MLTLQLRNNDYIIINSFILFIFALLVANGDINILASQDISNGGSKYRQDTISMSYDILAGTLTIPTYSHSSQTNSNSSLKNNNSTIMSDVGNITIEAKNKDINIKGANMLAQANENNVGGNINMDIGNNLNIESLQDTYYAKSKSSSFGISAGVVKIKMVEQMEMQDLMLVKQTQQQIVNW